MKKVYLLMVMCFTILTAAAQDVKKLVMTIDMPTYLPNWFSGDVPEGISYRYDEISPYQHPGNADKGETREYRIIGLPANFKIVGMVIYAGGDKQKTSATAWGYIGDTKIIEFEWGGTKANHGYVNKANGGTLPMEIPIPDDMPTIGDNDLIIKNECLEEYSTFTSIEISYILEEDTPADYDLAVLTFEDKDYKGGGNMMGENDWTSLIDSKQYGGLLLYGESGMGYDEDEEPYWWFDENNTGLFSTLGERYGMYCYWGGGAAVSNYVTNTLDGASYTTQLAAYNPDGGKGGHEGSDNFIVCNGYDDQSAYGDDTRPVLTFADGEGKVIDHLYLALSAYTLNSLLNGDGFSAPAQAGDYVNIVFEGLDAEGNMLGQVTVPVLDAEGAPAMGYQKVDLSGLGAIVTLRLNMLSNLDNGYGLSVPAYYVLDDIAVRVPKQAANPTLTIDALGYASAVFAQAVTVPEGLTACVVESVNEADAHVHLTAYAQAGETVKAGTPSSSAAPRAPIPCNPARLRAQSLRRTCCRATPPRTWTARA